MAKQKILFGHLKAVCVKLLISFEKKIEEQIFLFLAGSIKLFIE